MERKTDDYSDSCQHLPPAQGYQRAKDLLKEHFGNEHKIATAYMDKSFAWSVIKSEDVKALLAFLRGCAMQWNISPIWRK